MSKTTTTVWVCDRCRRQQEEPTDLRGAEQKLPMGKGWVQTHRPNGVPVDLCRECRDQLDDFLAPLDGPTKPPAELVAQAYAAAGADQVDDAVDDIPF